MILINMEIGLGVKMKFSKRLFKKMAAPLSMVALLSVSASVQAEFKVVGYFPWWAGDDDVSKGK